MLGKYKLTYENGETVLLPVIYGLNITNESVTEGKDFSRGEYIRNSPFREISGLTMPEMVNGRAFSGQNMKIHSP